MCSLVPDFLCFKQNLKLSYIGAETNFNAYLQITEDLQRIKRFNAQEALDYGLIDKIVRPQRIKADAPRRDSGTGLG